MEAASGAYVGEGVGRDVVGVLLGVVVGVTLGESEADGETTATGVVISKGDVSGEVLGRLETGTRPHPVSSKKNETTATPNCFIA